jgi:heme exporter protein D
MLASLGGFAGHAMFAWLVIAIPAVALMTLALTVLLRHVPALAEAEAAAGD